MSTLFWLEWAGAFTGVGGALLLALNNDYSKYGFVLGLVSAVLWAIFGTKSEILGLVFMQCAFGLTAVIGVSRWLIIPWVKTAKKKETSDVC